jgi:two-component system sensor histidine kinase BaeS
MRADLERLLHKLLHDLRTPLGVAHGYLRLLQEGRLPTEAERDRALTGTRNALGRMSDICSDASASMAGSSDDADAVVPVATFVSALRTQLNLLGTPLLVGELPDASQMPVPVDTERLADATAVVLSATTRHHAGAALRVEARPRTLSFVLSRHDASPAESVVLTFPLENPQA